MQNNQIDPFPGTGYDQSPHPVIGFNSFSNTLFCILTGSQFSQNDVSLEEITNQASEANTYTMYEDMTCSDVIYAEVLYGDLVYEDVAYVLGNSTLYAQETKNERSWKHTQARIDLK